MLVGANVEILFSFVPEADMVDGTLLTVTATLSGDSIDEVHSSSLTVIVAQILGNQTCSPLLADAGDTISCTLFLGSLSLVVYLFLS